MPHPIDPALSCTEIVPEEAALVRRIFQAYADGQGYRSIAHRLNREGFTTKRGKAFSPATIRGILTNRNYIGLITYRYRKGTAKSLNRSIVPGTHEPIIEMELWTQVQELLPAGSQSVDHLHARFFPLSGLLKCPSCGKGMIPSHVRRKRKSIASTISYYYICGNYASHGSAACLAHHIRAGEAEQFVDNRLAHFLSNPIFMEELMAKVQEKYENDIAPLQERLKEVAGKESALQKRQLRCYELFEEDHIDGLELKRRLEGVTREDEKLKSERIELERTISGFSKQTYPPEQVRKAVENIESIIRNTAPPQKMALYRSLIQSITVPADRDMRQAVIHGNTGLFHVSISPLANEGGEPPEWKKQSG